MAKNVWEVTEADMAGQIELTGAIIKYPGWYWTKYVMTGKSHGPYATEAEAASSRGLAVAHDKAEAEVKASIRGLTKEEALEIATVLVRRDEPIHLEPIDPLNPDFGWHVHNPRTGETIT